MKKEQFKKTITNAWLFKMYLFQKMPIALFAGIRVRELNEEKCVVSVPYKWFSQNPFRSVYFATQAMAAEMSTGIPGLMAVTGAEKKVSMLVISLQASFVKKSSERIYFTCNNVAAIHNTVQEAISLGESKSVEAKSTGRLRDGTIVSEFSVIWSFKSKQSA